jgi:hypothetical protein
VPFGVCTRAIPSSCLAHRPAGLLLGDIDPAVLDVFRAHTQQVRLSLARVSRNWGIFVAETDGLSATLAGRIVADCANL